MFIAGKNNYCVLQFRPIQFLTAPITKKHIFSFDRYFTSRTYGICVSTRILEYSRNFHRCPVRDSILRNPLLETSLTLYAYPYPSLKQWISISALTGHFGAFSFLRFNRIHVVISPFLPIVAISDWRAIHEMPIHQGRKIIGGLYDFVVSTFGAWTSSISTQMMGWGKALAANAKLTLGLNTSAAVLGLGYIIGLKYALIIAGGSALVWFVVIPLVNPLLSMFDAATIGDTLTAMGINPAELNTPEGIFREIGRPIGIGGIAMAGLIGIIRQAGIIKSALSLAKNELGGKKTTTAEPRTQQDISMKTIMAVIIAALVATLVFFQFGVLGNWFQTIVALLIVFIIAFLFTTVAANAIAIVGSNPVSGMTLMTLILSSLVLVSVGLEGQSGMIAALVIGGVVCTALSMAGGFITDLKIGYWLGTTPRKQETWKFVGTVVSAATVAGVMIIMNKTYGFVGENALVAPQANAMAAVIKPLMTGGATPWLLYGLGAVIALLLTVLKVPALPFALGMFIPMELNAPLVVGGLVAWAVNRHKDAAQAKANNNRGTLIASGFIAGGALMGVVSAILAFAGANWTLEGWANSSGAQLLGLAMYLALIAFFINHSRKAKKE
nr:OPT/YSL family transporter [Alistipes sp.]